MKISLKSCKKKFTASGKQPRFNTVSNHISNVMSGTPSCFYPNLHGFLSRIERRRKFINRVIMFLYLCLPRSWASSTPASIRLWLGWAAHTLHRPAVSDVSRMFPSGLNAREKMVASWSLMVRTSSFSPIFQIQTRSSSPAKMMA